MLRYIMINIRISLAKIVHRLEQELLQFYQTCSKKLVTPYAD